MSTATHLITAEEFAAMTFDRPVELIEGEIVEMTSPGGIHGGICLAIARIVGNWIHSGADFLATANDSGIVLARNPDTVRGPDLMIISRKRLPEGQYPQGHFTVVPEVAIEVKSPSDYWPEILNKVSQFLSAGVQEVWVIDPDHFRVHVYRVDDEPTIYNRVDQLTSVCLPDFHCEVKELFHGVPSPNSNN